MAVDPSAFGLAAGVLADAVFGDPRRGHPVAGFGSLAARLEVQLYSDRRARGVVHTVLCVGGAAVLGGLAQRATRDRPWGRAAVTAAATWAVLGGTSLAWEGEVMADLLESGDLDGARNRLSHLCARDPAGMDAVALARASVESLAENVSDAVVAPLLWGALAGVPGLLGYRAVNTLDAMVGYRSERYRRFGWSAARLDDLANWVPARLSVPVLAAAVSWAGGSARQALRVAHRDAHRHPSPNAGRPEAAVAGGLGLRLGGDHRGQAHHPHGPAQVGRVERRPELGATGRAPTPADLRRTVRVVRLATVVAAVGTVAARVAVLARWGPRAQRSAGR